MPTEYVCSVVTILSFGSEVAEVDAAAAVESFEIRHHLTVDEWVVERQVTYVKHAEGFGHPSPPLPTQKDLERKQCPERVTVVSDARVVLSEDASERVRHQVTLDSRIGRTEC